MKTERTRTYKANMILAVIVGTIGVAVLIWWAILTL